MSFLFWQLIRYFINGAKFSLNKELPARLIGIAWKTGDMLTYHILPDDASRKNPTVLTRSVIIPDDGNDYVYLAVKSANKPDANLKQIILPLKENGNPPLPGT